MKKFLAIFFALTLVLAFALVSCNDKAEGDATDNAGESESLQES